MKPDENAEDAVTRLRDLASQLSVLRDEMRRRYVEAATVFEGIHPTHRQSASNWIYYLRLRSFDLRDVQESQAELGLSSLGRAEEHVITTYLARARCWWPPAAVKPSWVLCPRRASPEVVRR